MPATNRVECRCSVCGPHGKSIPPRLKRIHDDNALRNSSRSVRPLSSAPRFQRPVLSNSTSLLPTAALMPVTPDVSSMDQSGWSHPTALEQNMLERGTMLESDLQLDAPHFGHGIPNPTILEAYVDHFEQLNAATAAAAHPLTSWAAHSGPPSGSQSSSQSPNVREIVAYLENLAKAAEDLDEEDIVDNTLGPPNPPSDLVCDVAELDAAEDEGEGEGGADGSPSEYSGDADAFMLENALDGEQNGLDSGMATTGIACPQGVCRDRWDALMCHAPWEDLAPDPFLPTYNVEPPPKLDNIPLHLLCIYTIVPWAHLQFSLPVIAANALLLCFAVVVGLLAPSAPTPFLTLKKVNDLVGLDVPFQVLAVCSGCKSVNPSSAFDPAKCPHCETPLFKEAKTSRSFFRGSREPIIKYPYMSLSEQLERLLQIEGMEALLDLWRTLPRKPGVLRDTFDGSVPQTLLGPDGRSFFENGPQHARGPGGELRIGLQWGVDWFSYLKSNIAPSHSSCPTSFSISNLPPEFRYRTSNLLLTSILPGPKEQSGDQLQAFIRPIVGDLLRLWRDGIRVKTPSCPNGRLVRVILIAVVCDKPAAHKMGGFGSHNHTYFCTQDWIKQDQKATPDSFVRGAFRERTDNSHRSLGAQYAQLKTQRARDLFVKEHATRYTELSRLPYFNIVEQVVIDPMHNLFLGLVKTHFYHIWIQMGILRENHELRVLHEMLRDFVVPTSAGKLPKDIGTPAGGSLTADQWRLLAVVEGPIVIPQLWASCLPNDPTKLLNDRVERIAREELQKLEEKRRAAAERARKKAEKDTAQKKPSKSVMNTGEAAHPSPQLPSATQSNAVPAITAIAAATATTTQVTPATTSTTKPRGEQVYSLHPDDPANFLKLSEALRLLTSHVLTTAEIKDADKLLREYCTELLRLYGKGAIRPNHHYATHVPDFALMFGPLHNFWSFLFERLNKVLKSYNTNNRGDGELETTFFTEFHRTSASARMTAYMKHADHAPLVKHLGNAMAKATNESRGTVAGLASWANDVDDALAEVHPWSIPYALSQRKNIRTLSSETYRLLLTHLTTRFPSWHLHSMIGRPRYPDSAPMKDTATFFDHVVLAGHRYYATTEVTTKHSSYVEVFLDSGSTPQPAVRSGELLEIFEWQQNLITPPFWFARIRWFRKWEGEREDIWRHYQHLGVRLWHIEDYEREGELNPIVPLTHIKGYLALKTVTVGRGRVKVWASIPLDHTQRHL